METARRLWQSATTNGLSALAALAADRRLAARHRAVALLAVAFALADDPSASAPDAALDAVEDPDTIAAVIEGRLFAALTGVLAAAPLDGSLRATRLLIGRRLLAVGETGPHVIGLLIDAGDRVRAGEAAAADLVAYLWTARQSPETWARLHLLVRWCKDGELAGALARALAEHPIAVDRLLELLQHAPGIAPDAVAGVRTAITNREDR